MDTKSSTVFWRTAVPFGVAMATMQLVQGKYVAAVAGGVLGGALFGGAMAFMSRRGARRLERQGIAGGDMNPMQTRTIDLPRPMHEAFAASKTALLAIPRLRVIRETAEAGELDARVGMTMRSVGENVAVRIKPNPGGGSHISISSEPRLKTTLVDYGKGVENVELFIRRISG